MSYGKLEQSFKQSPTPAFISWTTLLFAFENENLYIAEVEVSQKKTPDKRILGSEVEFLVFFKTHLDESLMINCDND